MADKARVVWLLLAVAGVVVAAAAGVSALVGGAPEVDAAADEPALGLAAESAATSRSGSGSEPPKTESPQARPAAVVDRFLDAVLAADCERALEQVTPAFEQREGDCALFAGDMEGWDYTVGKAEVEEDSSTAIVPARLTLAGQHDDYRWRLVLTKGTWQIADVEQ